MDRLHAQIEAQRTALAKREEVRKKLEVRRHAIICNLNPHANLLPGPAILLSLSTSSLSLTTVQQKILTDKQKGAASLALEAMFGAKARIAASPAKSGSRWAKLSKNVDIAEAALQEASK